MNIYVGNLAREVSGEDLQALFATFGQVSSAAVIKDKFTGESRGFGFVEMGNAEEGKAAIAGLNGKDLKGRNITVNEARPKTEGSGGGRSGGGFGGGRGGYGGGRGGSSSQGSRGHGRGSWGGRGW